MGKNLQRLKSKAKFYDRRAGKMAAGAVGAGLVTAAVETVALSGGMKEKIAQEMIANNDSINIAFNLFSCNTLQELKDILPNFANDQTAYIFCHNAIRSFEKIDIAAGQEAMMATAQSLPVVATVIGFAALGIGLYVWNKKKAKAINNEAEELREKNRQEKQSEKL